jgi:hypothetical protein
MPTLILALSNSDSSLPGACSIGSLDLIENRSLGGEKSVPSSPRSADSKSRRIATMRKESSINLISPQARDLPQGCIDVHGRQERPSTGNLITFSPNPKIEGFLK